MYIPTGCKTLKDSIEEQIRLGIQGFGGTGKTYSGLTFENPIALNIDRGLGAHNGRDDVIEVPLWNQTYCRSINPKHTKPYHLKDTIRIWLYNEGPKLEPNQTLVYDGNTGTQNAYHKAWAEEPVYTKKGAIDDFAEWGQKLAYYADIIELLKTLKCNIVFICHETDKKEKSGEYIGRIRPLLSGQFGDQLVSHFTDWFRQLTAEKPKDFSTIKQEDLDKWKMTRIEFQEMCKSWGRENTLYYWQTESDNIFDGKAGSLINFPKFMPANYQSFRKYMRIKV